MYTTHPLAGNMTTEKKKTGYKATANKHTHAHIWNYANYTLGLLTYVDVPTFRTFSSQTECTFSPSVHPIMYNHVKSL